MTDAERAALQPGQWIKCGDASHLSRFYRFNPATGSVTAFHGSAPHATRKMRSYIAAGREAAARKAANRAERLA